MDRECGGQRDWEGAGGGAGDDAPAGSGGRALGVDLGSKRIGLALSDPEGRIATPLLVLHRQGGKADLREIAQIARDYEADVIVVGLPINLRGEQALAAEGAVAEVAALRQLVARPVVMLDERLTTAAAEKALLAGGVSRGRRREVIDKVAATLLLQGYLDAKRHTNYDPPET